MAFKMKYNKGSFPFKKVVKENIIKDPGEKYHEGKWGKFSTTEKVYEDEEPTPPPKTRSKAKLHDFKITMPPPASKEGKKPLPSTMAEYNILKGGSRYVDEIFKNRS
tara:strand:- start:351 stop:671 length:321 start_codon:yes stop_codon:yes gene_type:complete